MKKKKDLIQLSNSEYYRSNEYNSKKVNYEDAKRNYYVENKDARRLYYEENKDGTRQYYEGKKDDKRQNYEENKDTKKLRNIISKKRTKNNITT